MLNFYVIKPINLVAGICKQTFERLKQEDLEFEASLSYTAGSCFKIQK